jgi:hypothetical protein
MLKKRFSRGRFITKKPSAWAGKTRGFLNIVFPELFSTSCKPATGRFRRTRHEGKMETATLQKAFVNGCC